MKNLKSFENFDYKGLGTLSGMDHPGSLRGWEKSSVDSSSKAKDWWNGLNPEEQQALADEYFPGALSLDRDDIEEIFRNELNSNEGKAFKASRNPFGDKTKEDKKDQFRKAVEDHIKDKGCKTKKVGDDFEIHADGEHVAQVMFRNDKVTVKKQGNKFGKDFEYNQLGKIKAEITDIIK